MSDGISNKQLGPLSRVVLEFDRTIKRLVEKAKQPGFTLADWAPLANLVAVEEFSRIGVWREEMNWQEYIEFLTKWATSTTFDDTLRRITEVSNLVFFEIQERNGGADDAGEVVPVNTNTVFEFNDAGKIRHLDVYIQGRF